MYQFYLLHVIRIIEEKMKNGTFIKSLYHFQTEITKNIQLLNREAQCKGYGG